MPQTDTHANVGASYENNIFIEKRIDSFNIVESINANNGFAYGNTVNENTTVFVEGSAKLNAYYLLKGQLDKLDIPANHISSVYFDQRNITKNGGLLLIDGDTAVSQGKNILPLELVHAICPKKVNVNSVVLKIRNATKFFEDSFYDHKLKTLKVKKKVIDISYKARRYLQPVMKLPEFWWKVTEVEVDYFRVDFCMESKYVDDTWNHWDGKTFIFSNKVKWFVQKQNIKDMFNDDDTSSRRDLTPLEFENSDADAARDYLPLSCEYADLIHDGTCNISFFTIKDVVNANPGLRMITWETHIMMNLLFYCYYGTTHVNKLYYC